MLVRLRLRLHSRRKTSNLATGGHRHFGFHPAVVITLGLHFFLAVLVVAIEEEKGSENATAAGRSSDQNVEKRVLIHVIEGEGRRIDLSSGQSRLRSLGTHGRICDLNVFLTRRLAIDRCQRHSGVGNGCSINMWSHRRCGPSGGVRLPMIKATVRVVRVA